jgi:predicted dehydrogenase/nucleoside-diphosphate-sugar epimerase
MIENPNRGQGKINVGLIGVGFIADLHLEALKRITGVRIDGCCDLDRGRADSFAKRHGIVCSYENYDKMLTERKLDAVHILVPPDYHFKIAKDVIESGNNVYLEKPMALSSEECYEIVERAKQNNVYVGVNHNFLFYPLFKKLQKDIRNYQIGPPEYVIAFYGGPLGQLDSGKFGHWMFQDPKNIILEQGPHPISQIRAILGEVVDISGRARGLRKLGKRQFFYDRWEGSIECENGHGFCHLSFGSRYSPQRALHIYGQDGAIFVDFLSNRYLVQKKSVFPDYLDPTARAMHFLPPVAGGVKDFTCYALSKIGLKDRTDAFFTTMKESISAFYNALKSRNQNIPVTGEDGMKIIEACERWIESVGPLKRNEPAEIVAHKDGDDAEVLVTGATGFIGGEVVKQLVKKGIRVRVMVRNINGLGETLHSPLVRVMVGDITKPESIFRAVRGVKFVFHLAHALGQTWEDFERLNIVPAKVFADACIKGGVKSFIYVSSIAAFYYGDLPKRLVTADSPIDQLPEKRNLYARSKIEIENMLTNKAKENGLPLIIFRPGIVVGTGGITYHSGVGLWTRDNVCSYWGWGRHELPFILVRDVADAMIKVIDIEGLEGKFLNLVGDVRISAKEYIDLLRQHSRRNIVAFPYPILLLFFSDTIKYCIKYIGGDKGGQLSYRDLANRAVRASFDCQNEKRLLNWSACDDRDQFVQEAIVSHFTNA